MFEGALIDGKIDNKVKHRPFGPTNF